MKKTAATLLLVFCLGILSLSNGYGACIWDTTKTQLVNGQTGGRGFSYNGKFYIVGGTVPPNVNSGRVQKYDPLSDTWSTMTPMPTERHVFAGGLIDSVFYTIGGLNTLTVNEAYYPGTNTWITKSSMPTGRGHINATVLYDSLLYVIGGWNGSSIIATVEAYNARSDTWITGISPVNIARGNGGAVTINDKIYYFGGASSASQYYSLTEMYDPVLNTWVIKDSMNVPRGNMSYGVINGKIYVMGGGNFTTDYLESIEVYDPQEDEWTVLDCTMLHPRFRSEFAVLNGSLYIASGQSQIPATDWSSYFDIFTPIETDSLILSIPDTNLVGPGSFPTDTVTIPVYLDTIEYNNHYGIRSFQFGLTYDNTSFECLGYDTTGTILSNYGGLREFTVQFHKDAGSIGGRDTLFIAGACDDSIYYSEVPGTPFAFPRNLINLKFQIKSNVSSGDSTELHFIPEGHSTQNPNILLNEGMPGVAANDGSIKIRLRRYGDVDQDGLIIPIDAVLVLRHVIKDTILTGEGLIAAEVSGNGEITAYDAALILMHYVGKITTFPVGDFFKRSLLSNRSAVVALDWGEVRDGMITLNINAENLTELYGYSFEMAFDPAVLTYQGARLSGLTREMLNVVSTEDGVIRFAAAGSEPVEGDGVLAHITFRVTGDVSDEDIIKLTQVILNEELVLSEAASAAIPKTYSLEQNYPNPFNPTTRIRYHIPEAAQVQILIYNTLGQRVRTLVDESRPAGAYEVTWDGTNDLGVRVASGIYIYQMKAGNFDQIRKLIIIK